MKRRRRKKEEVFVAAHVETIAHVVLRDGQPCKLVNVSGMHKGGVLEPGLPGEVVISFAKLRDARRAVERTLRARNVLSTSLVGEWLRSQFPSFIAGQRFEIVPIGRQV